MARAEKQTDTFTNRIEALANLNPTATEPLVILNRTAVDRDLIATEPKPNHDRNWARLFVRRLK